MNRTGRNSTDDIASSFIVLTSSSPPVNLTGLEPESSYSVEIETELNPKWRTTMTLEEVHTTANNSQLPEGIVGVRRGVMIFWGLCV